MAVISGLGPTWKLMKNCHKELCGTSVAMSRSLILLAFLLSLALGLAMAPEAPFAGRGGGGARASPHLLRPKMGTLRAQGPNGPKELLPSLGQKHKSLKMLFLGSYKALKGLIRLSRAL